MKGAALSGLAGAAADAVWQWQGGPDSAWWACGLGLGAAIVCGVWAGLARR